MEKAIFAAGCFWGVEDAFRKVPGVTDAISGYTGGHKDNPSYVEVCRDTTGHAEAVEVTFDPAQVTYEALVRKFFGLHDPTQMNRQGPDVGSQYRSAIFTLSDEQKQVAERVKGELAPNFYPKTVATEITNATTFWKAEDYHQRYFEKNPGRAVCHI
ncbi:MAG: peptide-methionine (S)-S-oxide reductase MsrA [Candidatus Pacebacteria bacterium]|nr:peptide-methionine (S)-S-oxide reductase MsrA [Candidatus Paceibacterota bacterium]MBP9840329.1 peptide-methionine (S)-S-oxide reductase MsrA [Candidatus Paceibacterota bacterium]